MKAVVAAPACSASRSTVVRPMPGWMLLLLLLRCMAVSNKSKQKYVALMQVGVVQHALWALSGSSLRATTSHQNAWLQPFTEAASDTSAMHILQTLVSSSAALAMLSIRRFVWLPVKLAMFGEQAANVREQHSQTDLALIESFVQAHSSACCAVMTVIFSTLLLNPTVPQL